MAQTFEADFSALQPTLVCPKAPDLEKLFVNMTEAEPKRRKSLADVGRALAGIWAPTRRGIAGPFSGPAGSDNICDDCREFFLALASDRPHPYTIRSGRRGRKFAQSPDCCVCVLLRTALDSRYDSSVWLKPTRRNLLHDDGESKGRVGIEFLCLMVESSPWAMFRIARLRGSDSNLIGQQVLALADMSEALNWIKTCQDHHVQCRRHEPEARSLPTRLLQVRHSMFAEDDSVRLIETCPGDVGTYVALSHCWGDHKPLMMTKANKNELMRGLSLQTLPQTFKDAVMVTRDLAYGLLWIDSLCITQDDPHDWAAECGKMHATFENAALTIAASDAPNASIGFLARTAPHTIPDNNRACEFDIRTEDGAFDATLLLERVHRDRRHRRGFKAGSGVEFEYRLPSLLDKRGWALQERLLSVRLLQFGRSHMSFECNTSQCHERSQYALHEEHFTRGPQIDDPFPGLQLSKSLLAVEKDPMRAWRSIVVNHSRRSLTFGRDKLPSLSGVARIIAARANDVYLAGLWRKTLATDLVWQRSRNWKTHTVTSKWTVEPQAATPTWSWASCPFSIEFPWYYPDQKDSLEIMDAWTTQAGSDQYGQVQNGRITLSGMLTNGAVHLVELDFESPSAWSSGVRVEIGLDETEQAVITHAELVLDRPRQRPANNCDTLERARMEARLLLVRECNDPTSWNWLALVLLPLPDDEDTFQRTGMLSGYLGDSRPSRCLPVDIFSRRTIHLV